MALVLVKEEFHEIMNLKVELLSSSRDIKKSVPITGAGGGPVTMDGHGSIYHHNHTHYTMLA